METTRTRIAYLAGRMRNMARELPVMLLQLDLIHQELERFGHEEEYIPCDMTAELEQYLMALKGQIAIVESGLERGLVLADFQIYSKPRLWYMERIERIHHEIQEDPSQKHLDERLTQIESLSEDLLREVQTAMSAELHSELSRARHRVLEAHNQYHLKQRFKTELRGEGWVVNISPP